MTTSSARPAALDEAAAGITSAVNRLDATARWVSETARAYRLSCPDVPLSLTSSFTVVRTLPHDRALANRLREVAEAFRSADRSTGLALEDRTRGLVAVRDLTLSNAIVASHPGLAQELSGPTRALVRRGEALADEMIETMQGRGSAAAIALLDEADDIDLGRPIFAAAVVNRLGADRLRAMAEELAPAAVTWQNRFGPFADLSTLWNTATRTFDLHPRAPGLDLGLLDRLLSTAGGRNVLRALTGSSDAAPGASYLRRVTDDLLGRSAVDDASISAVYLLLRGAGREGHPDAAMIHAWARTPGGAAAYFLQGHISGEHDGSIAGRTVALLALGEGAQPAVALLLGRALADDRFSASTNERDRTEVLSAAYSWAVERDGNDVTAAMAQFLADSLVTDMDFYLGRIDTGRRGDLTKFFKAVTEYERPWMTALVAFQNHGIRQVRATLHGTAEERLTALVPITSLEDHFEEAAEATDRPVDHAAGFFALLKVVADTSRQLAKLHPVASIAAAAVIDKGLEEWHSATIPDPDDHEVRTRLAREGLRRRIWAVIASDDVLGAQLDWSVGGRTPDRHQVVGSRITSLDALLDLTGTDEDLDELAGWSSHQPEHLRTIVESYLAGAS